uniref:ankyrin repeat domain-containing protein 7-like n=1 Tax=Lonchura striata TaxID=40157 RepID=UPI001292DA90|nr:ankyrin repeat domain-containing protein 7-like [Lonchura striata domestica]
MTIAGMSLDYSKSSSNDFSAKLPFCSGIPSSWSLLVSLSSVIFTAAGRNEKLIRSTPSSTAYTFLLTETFLSLQRTPLHLACINGHADVVQFLVEKKCKLNPCDRLDKSPLIKAVEHQHRDCAAILLEHGANQDHRAVNGNTALHFAVMASSKSLVKLLLEHGADIDAKNKVSLDFG